MISLKNYIFNIILGLGILLAAGDLAAAPPLLVFDAFSTFSLPKNFRATDDPINTAEISAQQLTQLQAFGSAQFSAKQLQQVLKKVSFPLAIIDLRQESHGFVNGHAISWYGVHNWNNCHKTASEVEKDQEKKLNHLANSRQTIINTLIKFPDGKLKRVPINVNIHQVFSEAQLAKQYHLQYLRLYITDGQKPTDQQVDRFIEFVKTLPENTILYFHCRAGKGRTTMLMAMYDMMQNAIPLEPQDMKLGAEFTRDLNDSALENSKEYSLYFEGFPTRNHLKVDAKSDAQLHILRSERYKYASFSEIMQRQFLIGGKNLLVLPNKKSYKYSFALSRKLFLKDFYYYCREQSALQFNTRWTEWITKHY